MGGAHVYSGSRPRPAGILAASGTETSDTLKQMIPSPENFVTGISPPPGQLARRATPARCGSSRQ
jgi:hypothetical protein